MIRKRIVLLNVVSIITLLFFGIFANWALSQSFVTVDRMSQAMSMLKNHQSADMMHDAIRGDVLGAVLAALDGDTQGISDAEADLKAHAQQLKDNLEANQKLHVSAEIDKALKDAGPDLDGYIEQASTIIQTAYKDSSAAQDAYPTIMDSFSKLEDSLGAISDLLQTNIENTNADLNNKKSFYTATLLALVAILLLVTITATLKTFSWLLNPLKEMIGVMDKMTQGDMDIDIPAVTNKDEMGDMGRALQIFRDNAQQRLELEKQQRAEDEKKAQRASMMDSLTRSFDQNITSFLEKLNAATSQMQGTTTTLSALAEEGSVQSSNLTSTVEQTLANINMVAASAEELSASIQEINQQVSRSNRISQEAVEKAHAADNVIRNLQESANKISEINLMINEIAEQINLLALNATIEAARAGEAGKGFAVVASEVKNLATQTASATSQIGGYIESTQLASDDTAKVLSEIRATITEMSTISTAIAAAIEEQGAATQEIARSIGDVASGTKEVSNNVSGVAEASNETGRAATQVDSATRSVSEQTASLTQEVKNFLQGIKAA